MHIPSEVESIFPKLVEWRRDFHKNPELGFQEVRTSEVIANHLRSLGIEVKTGVAKTGVVGILKGEAGEGKVLLLRADMDALPIKEENKTEYSSQNEGVMHACGHDAHMAILMGAAQILAEQKEQLKGTIKFVFQPAEEGPGGAKPMIDEGVLENPKVDAALGLHVWNDYKVGLIGVKSGPILASADSFQFRIIGKGGHGAAPHHSIDSVLVASHAIVALQAIASRRVDPQSPVVVTVGTINGGYRSNVIAPDVKCSGTFRTFEEDMRQKISDMIEETIAGVCKTFGANYEYKRIPNYPPTVNDKKITELVRKAAEKVMGKENVIEAKPSMGAEDMSYFLQAVPGCFFLVGSAPEHGEAFPHHHPKFDIDERALKFGLATLLEAVKMFMNSNSNGSA